MEYVGHKTKQLSLYGNRPGSFTRPLRALRSKSSQSSILLVYNTILMIPTEAAKLGKPPGPGFAVRYVRVHIHELTCPC